jgi:hypothetical protein
VSKEYSIRRQILRTSKIALQAREDKLIMLQRIQSRLAMLVSKTKRGESHDSGEQLRFHISLINIKQYQYSVGSYKGLTGGNTTACFIKISATFA